MQNVSRVVEVVERVAEAVGVLLDRGGTPLVIGGDCTITLGVVAAYARRMPDLGLVYFDGDIDVATAETTTSGVLDTMGMSHLRVGASRLAGIGDRCRCLPPTTSSRSVDEREATDGGARAVAQARTAGQRTR
jgi:arginase